jgi:hypothetical protein
MLSTMKRGVLVGGLVVVVAALLSGSALAARGHGQAKFAVRAGGFADFAGSSDRGIFGVFGGRGFGGPVFAGPGFGFGGPGMRGHAFGEGPGMRGGAGAGLLASDVLKTAASYLQMPLADLQTALKGGKTLAQVATDKGKTAAGLVDAITAAAKANLDAAVAAGWLTQKQADAVLEGVTAEAKSLVNDGPGVPRTPAAKKAGPLDAAATYLGISTDDIQSALRNGKTLASLVAAPKTVEGLVDAMTADAKTRLDKAVSDGDITSAQENTILTKLKAQVTDFVNGVHGPKAATTTTNAINKTLIKYTVHKNTVRR